MFCSVPILLSIPIASLVYIATAPLLLIPPPLIFHCHCHWHHDHHIVLQEGTPLHTAYSFSFMRRGKASKPDEGNPAAQQQQSDKPTEEKQETTTAPHPYENSIKNISTVQSVEQFWSTYNYLKRPNDLSSTTDYHFFRDGIKPTWEDPKNAKGGKWIVSDKHRQYARQVELIITNSGSNSIRLFVRRVHSKDSISLIHSFVHYFLCLRSWNFIPSSFYSSRLSISLYLFIYFPRSVCPRD